MIERRANYSSCEEVSPRLVGCAHPRQKATRDVYLLDRWRRSLLMLHPTNDRPTAHIWRTVGYGRLGHVRSHGTTA
jgi:hypothetical protein